MSSYKLYSFYLSSTAFRARIALNLKKIKPQYIGMDIMKGDHLTGEYGKVNPNTGVPTLILTDGRCIVESIAIIEYLNEVYPEPHNLYPGDAADRAQIRGFCEVINSGIHPYQNLKLVNKIEKEFKGDRIKWSTEWVGKGVDIIEKMLAQHSSGNYKYSFGNNITAADVVFYPQIYASKNRWKIDLQPYQHVSRVFKNLSTIK